METALFSFLYEINKIIDQREIGVALYIDLSKAFDTLCHDILIQKLLLYGIRGTPLQWFKSYLQGRTQRVKVSSDRGSILSDIANITVGVPQGSILGPLLFVIYANDLHYVFKDLPVILMSYADDTNLIIKVSNRSDIEPMVDLVFSKVQDWMNKNKLVINNDKTACMFFRSPRSNLCLNNVTLAGTRMDFCREIRLLGFYVDCHLNYNAHIEHLCKKLSSVCFGLRTLSSQCSPTILKTLYYANFYSHLRYGIIHWGRAVGVNRVFVLQKYIVRVIKGLKFGETCREAFKELNILTVAGVYIYELLCFVRNNMMCFQKAFAATPYETRHKNSLCVDQHTTTLYQKSAHYNGCLIFNALPNKIKCAPTINIFKSKIKKLVIDISPYSIKEFLDKI